MAAAPNFAPSFLVDIVGPDSTPAYLSLTAYTSTPGQTGYFQFGRARGTYSQPSAIKMNDAIGLITFRGYSTNHDLTTGGAFDSIARRAFGIYASEDWWADNNPTIGGGIYLSFLTRPNGTNQAVTERMRIDQNGNVGVGTIASKSALHVVGLPVYANNAAALAGGLTAGAFYRTGQDPDVLCVVH